MDFIQIIETRKSIIPNDLFLLLQLNLRETIEQMDSDV